jgi:biopolymer transport protein TolR
MAGHIDSGFSRRGRSYAPMSEINVTPFVDVMLVLLVVFMVTAPLLAVGVPVDLPKAKAQALDEDQMPLALTVDAEGRIFIQETEVSMTDLVPRLLAISDAKTDTRIYMRGDKNVDYGRVLEVMGAVNGAGFKKVALVAKMPEPRR